MKLLFVAMLAWCAYLPMSTEAAVFGNHCNADAAWTSCFIDKANWQGKLDLQSSVQPFVPRELHDGQWLAGLAHPNIYHLDHKGTIIFHAGVFQVWNAEHGNASFGLLTGVDLMGLSKEAGFDIPRGLYDLGNALHIPTLFKPAVYFANLTSLDVFVGYRPVHSVDVIGELVYGIGPCVNIPFGTGELNGPTAP